MLMAVAWCCFLFRSDFSPRRPEYTGIPYVHVSSPSGECLVHAIMPGSLDIFFPMHLNSCLLLQLFDRSGVLYGELARFVLRLLGVKRKPRNPHHQGPGALPGLGPQGQNYIEGPPVQNYIEGSKAASGSWDNVWGSDGKWTKPIMGSLSENSQALQARKVWTFCLNIMQKWPLPPCSSS